MTLTRKMSNKDENEWLKENFSKYGNYLWEISKIYIFWICLHYISVNLYAYFCAHLSLTGIFLSPLMVITPQCKALNWLVNNSIVNINGMWVVLTTWIMSKLVE
tara:strand:- start:203 stop:514 length:312 start_codon:yes stop_codon:yes gene_type:complete